MKKKRQHYVQKRLLRNFSKNGKVWVFDKLNKRSFTSSIINTGLEKSFLDTDADDVITEIESECYYVIERILDKKCIFCRDFEDIESKENLFKLYRYLGCQLTRTPKWREYLKELNDYYSTIPNITKAQNEYFTNNNIYPFLNFRIADEGEAEEKTGHIAKLYNSYTNEYSNISLKRFDEISAGLIDVVIPFVLINNSERPFIINDSGANWHLGQEGIEYEFKLRGKKLVSWLNFPLSPKICLLFCTLSSTNEWAKTVPEDSDIGMIIETKNTKQIDLVNKIIFHSTRRFIYFSDRRLSRRAAKIYSKTGFISK